MVHGEAVLQAVRAAGVLGDVAADRADLLARGVGRVEEAVLRDGPGDVEVGDAGLDDDALAVEVDLEDPVHSRERDHDPARDRSRSAREPGPRAARHERNAFPATGAHDGLHLLGGGGKDDELGDRSMPGQPVALVDAELLRLGDHLLRLRARFEARPRTRSEGPSTSLGSQNASNAPGSLGSASTSLHQATFDAEEEHLVELEDTSVLEPRARCTAPRPGPRSRGRREATTRTSRPSPSEVARGSGRSPRARGTRRPSRRGPARSRPRPRRRGRAARSPPCARTRRRSRGRGLRCQPRPRSSSQRASKPSTCRRWASVKGIVETRRLASAGSSFSTAASRCSRRGVGCLS